ncbi:MAG: ATP-binding protein, partial [Desulfuromonadaceae bacterium]|nr:ATP-binding protein [Desulfuromonadaceae bacterium]
SPLSGEKIPIEFTCSGAMFQGELLGVTVIREISDRLVLEAQLLQQQKLESVGLLVGGIAHDFNNLLAPIFVYSEMIRNRFPEGDVNQKQASAINQSASKAKELIKQLLTFSRKQELEVKQIDLNEIITAFSEILRRTIRENVIINTSLDSESCQIIADRTQIEQILLNLVVNAQDAITGNGRITIGTAQVMLDDEYCAIHPGSRPAAYIMLTVSDNGCGMDNKTLEHIFEPFFSTKALGSGTGLGLSTVYGIVRQHDGMVNVQSTPGNGTSFIIYLPKAKIDHEVTNSSEISDTERVTAASATILLVEDNEMVMDMTRELLESCGYTVLSAWLPEEALVIALRDPGRIDLLLSDVVMPQMSGPELYQRLKDVIPDLKVIYMSGYTNNVVVHKGALDEAAVFIAKPFTSATLLAHVSRILE